jgi:hypothetical protein
MCRVRQVDIETMQQVLAEQGMEIRIGKTEMVTYGNGYDWANYSNVYKGFGGVYTKNHNGHENYFIQGTGRRGDPWRGELIDPVRLDEPPPGVEWATDPANMGKHSEGAYPKSLRNVDIVVEGDMGIYAPDGELLATGRISEDGEVTWLWRKIDTGRWAPQREKVLTAMEAIKVAEVAQVIKDEEEEAVTYLNDVGRQYAQDFNVNIRVNVANRSKEGAEFETEIDFGEIF